jgi:hypothetical protein
MHTIPAALALLLALPAYADPLTLDLTFSDKALAELQTRGEMVTVAAYWMGDPLPGSTLPLSEIGTVFLQAEDVTLWPTPQRVTLGANLASAPMDQVTAPMVNVNVFTARHSDENNLIDCDFIDAPADEITTPQPILCKLIGE